MAVIVSICYANYNYEYNGNNGYNGYDRYNGSSKNYFRINVLIEFII